MIIYEGVTGTKLSKGRLPNALVTDEAIFTGRLPWFMDVIRIPRHETMFVTRNCFPRLDYHG